MSLQVGDTVRGKVVLRIIRGGRGKVVARCHCGRRFTCRRDHIFRYKSCGCLQTTKRLKVGQRFGRLTVLRRDPLAPRHADGHARWLCRCECGTKRSVYSHMLKGGRTRSCGCLRTELAARRSMTHGLSKTPTYACWRSMLARCLIPSASSYRRYGGRPDRPVRVCRRWRKFENFLADISKRIGKRPSKRHSLDRIDPWGDYRPGNVRWATPKQQRVNQRRRRRSTAAS